jgi:ParB-like chromosome segregation protein Spo0J
MSKLEPHPFSALFPPISEEDFGKLVADIKANGLQQSIVRYQGKILDGNNRYRACGLAGIEPTFRDFNGTDTQAQSYVISANIHRRHLSPKERAEIIATLLRTDPGKTNRSIAFAAKADHKTVGTVREKLEASGEIPHIETRIDSVGRTQPSKKGKSGKRSEHDTIKYPKVTNASTALKAYHVFEQHLLDALQDVNDKSDFSQADELAQATIENLQERLGKMQPEMAEAAE